MSVIGRTTAACDGRPVIVRPADDDQCLSPVNQTAAGSTQSYNLRVLTRSKDIYTRLNQLVFSLAFLSKALPLTICFADYIHEYVTGNSRRYNDDDDSRSNEC